MKKRFITTIFIVAFLLPFSGNGQILISILFGEQLNSGKMEFGLVGGANIATMRGLESPKYTSNFGLGLFLDYKFDDHWFLGFEANVKTTLGARSLEFEDLPYPLNDTIFQRAESSERKLELINLPVFINYRFNKGLSIGAGTYLSWLHGTRDIVDFKDGPYEATFERSFTGSTNRFDVGFVGVVGYQFKGKLGMQIRGKVNYGVVDVFKGDAGVSANNIWYFIGVAVPVMINL